MKIINIGKEFSEEPAGRYITDGPFSGEKFREEILSPALRENEKVSIELDDVEGLGSSFLEESFGGLIRNKYFTVEELKQKLEVVTEDKGLEAEVWNYIENTDN